MQLYLVKPDLYYFDQYNDMMIEWAQSNTQIAPWFLNEPFENISDFAKFIQMLDNCEHANLDTQYSSTTSYFVINENDRLIGATSLRHYLTVSGYNTWGHIGYGVRPTERRKGYGTCMLKMMLKEARDRKMYHILIACHASNTGSVQVIEHCNGKLDKIMNDPDNPNETICQYWIDSRYE